MRAAYSYHLLCGSLRPPELAHRYPLAWAASRVVRGMVDHAQYAAECQAAIAQRLPMERLAQRCADDLAFDCNPVAWLMRGAPTPAAFEARWNGYNRRAAVGVRTFVDGAHSVARVAERSAVDSAFRRDAICALLDVLQAARRGPDDGHAPLLALARRLGLPAWACDLLALLHAQPSLTLDQAAAALGASRRTLQRRLHGEHLSYEGLQAAVRLTVASRAIALGQDSLTSIAHDMGFSDSAHLTRSWRAATGLAPSDFRALCGAGS